MDDPLVLLTPLELQSGSDPRLIDTIFNVSSLTSGIFNNSLFQYAGAIIVGIILFGRYIIYIISGFVIFLLQFLYLIKIQ